MAETCFERALELLRTDPGLGGAIAVGFRPENLPAGTRIPPYGRLTARNGTLTADLDQLPPSTQALLAQRLDAGGAWLVAWCAAGAPWPHLADRVAFLVPEAPAPSLPLGRPMSLARAMAALAQEAARLGLEGHRTTALALQAALAAARTAGRRRLHEGDVAEAVALVLAPRARPAPARQTAPPPPHSSPEQTAGRRQAQAPPLSAAAPPLPKARTRLRQGSLDLCATLLAALPWQRLRGATPPPPAIRRQDIRHFQDPVRHGRLIIFAVDGSGSMGARRLGQAKGAVLSLLHQAYRCRDQVALVVAAGSTARLVLPPARAVERARPALAGLPVGGATPLASALLLAARLSRQAAAKDQRQTLLIFLTDGRANQPLPNDSGEPAAVREGLKQASLYLRKQKVQSMVLGEPTAEARELALWLGGSHQLIYRRWAGSPAGRSN